MSAFAIDASDLDRLSANANAAASEIQPASLELVLGIAKDGVAIARPLAPVFTGQFRDSIHAEAHPGLGGAAATLGTTAKHGPTVEFGRRPGATPPPIGPIAEFLAAKGSDPGLAFVVSRKIGRSGIRARPTIRPAGAQAFARRGPHIARFRSRIRAHFGGG